MLKRKWLFLLQASLIFTLPCLGMDEDPLPSIPLKRMDFIKYTITEKSFAETMKAASERPGAQSLVEGLSQELEMLIDQNISIEDWKKEVARAYNKTLDAMPVFDMVIMLRDHPLAQIRRALNGALIDPTGRAALL